MVWFDAAVFDYDNPACASQVCAVCCIVRHGGRRPQQARFSEGDRKVLPWRFSKAPPLNIDLEGMVNEVPTAKERYEDEVAQAKEFVELLAPGRHSITSIQAEVGYNTQQENRNWYFAIGGYSTWGRGAAVVTDGVKGREFQLAFEYLFYDRHNWDKGKSVTFAGLTVTDHFMGEFHRQGLAQEFDCTGAIQRQFSWKKGGPIPGGQLNPPPSGSR